MNLTVPGDGIGIWLYMYVIDKKYNIIYNFIYIECYVKEWLCEGTD